jgi:hypothetical protein
MVQPVPGGAGKSCQQELSAATVGDRIESSNEGQRRATLFLGRIALMERFCDL